MNAILQTALSNIISSVKNFEENFTETVPNGPINNKPAVVRIMAWHQTGDKPLLYPPYPKDRGMLWFYVEAARNGVNAITQKPRDGLFSTLVYTLLVIVSWPD